MAKIKPAGKIAITVLVASAIVGSIIFLRPLVLPEGDKAQDVSGMMRGSASATASTTTNKCLEIGVVTWGGYIGGQWWNGGFKDNPNSRYHQDDICVNFSVMDDFAASRAAFKAGKMDLMWSTIDSFPTESGSFGEPVKWLFQADWSRGGDAIVTKGNVGAVGDLAGKKIAVAEATPSHTFLLWMLDMAGLSIMDVNVVKVNSAIDAAAAFKAGKVDAAVVWSPDDAACVQAVSGAKILVNTKQATHIISDGFFIKESTYNKRRPELVKLVRGWLKGAAEINASNEVKAKAAKVLADGLGSSVDAEFCIGAINNVRLTTYGDNLDFFGLNPGYTGVTGKDLYEKMTTVYGKLNLASGSLPWAQIVDTAFIKEINLEQEIGMVAEKKAAFTAPTKVEVAAKAVASKPVRVSFAHGSSELDENAKGIIDMMFVEQAKAFPTSRIRIEGNTDSTGSADVNRKISKARAQTVVSYLVETHKMDQNRFVVVGNGPDKPQCSDDTEICRARNRRTDFQILEN